MFGSNLEDALVMTTLTISHILCVSFKSGSLYWGLRLTQVYPNPEKSEPDLKLKWRLGVL